MVFKKYTYRNGRKYGPYYYENVRVGEKVITKYLGAESPFVDVKKDRTLNINYLLFAGIVLAMGLLLFVSFNDYSSPTGKITLSVDSFREGETLQGKLSLGLKKGELIPKDSEVLISYGNQSENFKLYELVSEETKTGKFYAEGSGLSGEGEGYGQFGTKKDFPEVDFQLLIHKNSQEAQGSEGLGNTVQEENSSQVSEEINISVSSASEEVVSENSNAESPADVTDSSSNTESSSDAVNTPSNTEVSLEGDLNPASDSIVQENTETGDAGNVANTESPVTGSAVSEGDYVISGSVKKGENFEYNLGEGETAEIVSGSVKSGNETLSDNAVNIDSKNGKAEVSTEYFVNTQGFGEEYLDGSIRKMEVDLSSFNLSAVEGKLLVKLVYEDIVISSYSKEVNLNSASLVLNETVNSSLILIKEIPQIRIAKSGVAELNLDEYFSGAERYEFSASNISAEFEEQGIILSADEGFSGVRKARIIAYLGGEKLESNEFTILVSSGAINIKTERDKIVVGQKVRWVANVSLETQENITIELPKEAENISVKTGEEEIDNSVVGITGKAVYYSSESSGFFVWIKHLFGITGRAVDISEETGKEVVLQEGASEYTVEYYTDAPQAFEEETDNGKRVIVSGPDNLNYTDVLSYTNIPEIFKLGEEEKIKIYWVENKSYLPFDAYDLDENGKLDYIEWVTPHLSNQTFDIILITRAEHLDSNRTFIEDVYDFVKEKDDVWKEIPANDYLRVTFERNLTPDRDITLYARSNYSGADVEVYDSFGSKVTEFGGIGEEKYYKVYLNNLTQEGDTFDLLVKNGNVEFDYVVDPFVDNSSLVQYIDQCGTLNTSYARYIMNGSITGVTSTCINITASNIVLDGNGKSISASSSINTIISSPGVTNLTIKGMNITLIGGGAFPSVIYLDGANNSAVFNNTFNGDVYYYGVRLESSSYNIFISNNTFITGSIGFYIRGANNTLIGNRVVSCASSGVFVSGDGNLIYNNNLSSCNSLSLSSSGISVGSAGNNVSGNFMFGNKNGIILTNASNNIFYNNSIYSTVERGIAVISSSLMSRNNSFLYNNFWNCTVNCIYLSNGDGNLFSGGIVNLSGSGPVDLQLGGQSLLIRLESGSDNNIFSDVVLLNAGMNETALFGSSMNNSFVNMTINLSKEYVESGSELFRKWHYRGYVDLAGSPVSGATVRAYNRSDSLISTFSTLGTGYTVQTSLPEYVNLGGTRSYYSNYTLYADNGVYFKNHSLNMSGNNLTDVFLLQNNAPVFGALENSVYVCEGSSLSKALTVSNDDADTLTITISPENPFFVTPSVSAGRKTTSIELFSGTLNKSKIGNYSEAITASDGTLNSRVYTNISVIEINNAPSLTSIDDKSVLSGADVYYKVNVSDLESGNQDSGNFTFSSSFVSGTEFFDINSSTGVINFTTNSSIEGSYTVQVCAEDTALSFIHPNISICGQTGEGRTACDSFVISISSPNSPAGSSDGSSSGGGSSGGGISSGENNEKPIPFNETCIPEYSCGEWGSCSQGFEQRACEDLRCGNNVKNERRPCSLNCTVNFVCSDWGQCNYLGKTEDIFNGKFLFNGYQERTCRDLNACVSEYSEEKSCSDNFDVNFVKISECGQDYLAAVSKDGKTPLSKISLESFRAKRLDISFSQGTGEICSSCFNGLQDSAEEGVDCGGDCKKCDLKVVIPRYWLLGALWFSFLVVFYIFLKDLSFVKIYTIRSLVRSGGRNLGKRNVKKAIKKYEKARKLYYGLNDKQKLDVMHELHDYYSKIKGGQ